MKSILEAGEEVVQTCYGIFVEWLKISGKDNLQKGPGIYSEALVMWLMMHQRLQQGASLARTVEEVANGASWDITGECKRLLDNRVSTNTGGYSQARNKLLLATAEEVGDAVFAWLKRTGSSDSIYHRPVCSIDGSTIELLRSKELIKQYPTTKNGHYPLMRILVCHDLQTGLAIRPEYGPQCGKHEKSESKLCLQMFPRLPKDSVIVGDRNFGIFSIANCARNEGIDVILRLTEVRAKKILGKALKHGTDQAVEWQISKNDLATNPHLPQDSMVTGRVICMNVKSYRGDKTTALYIFTTLKDSVEKILELYGLRWNIEIDLRTLKHTINMHMLNVKSANMAHKELVMGICAYNLACTVRQVAAIKLGIKPRDISFKRVLTAMSSFAPKITGASEKQKSLLVDRFWSVMACSKHPKRSSRRTEPRAIIRRKRTKYPILKQSRLAFKRNLMQKN